METTTEMYATLASWESRIRQRPLAVLAAAASLGFLMGGGLKSKAGLALAAFGCRMVLRQTAMGIAQSMFSADERRSQSTIHVATPAEI